ncbi:alpha/beta hydrolase family protein [Sphingobacterium yanglingense]|uniref:Acetyl xylan esterase AXE1 n=1 Tax=Sphingobacterium yanglingense TaxID=1437280 RepID=A0A4R6WEJ7_9SPHI|nr:acetylxylan esterase [Sphingobacterium yanglingense]TDQ78222.1 acetyl xylan esterase AXE1 [Sphingobacterium yanglingense]
MRLYIYFLFMMASTSMAIGQDAVPEVLGIPKHLDRTASYVQHRLKEVCMQHNSSKESIYGYVTSHLGLDKAEMGSLDVQVVKEMDLGDFVLRYIVFQTMEGVYVPAHLYVPKGEGPFPAVLNSHGHWPNGKAGEIVQRTAQLLARNGYVCLTMDAWGSGERGANHVHEYHGARLGSSLLDLGVPLMGMQVLENKRAIDLLQSLEYVDSERIAATGASGGGNQTFWISTLDERVKAAVPVVSIGTFESYILNSNCVCELLPHGLMHLETSDMLAAVAPKPIKILSALRDGNAAFNVGEMLRTFNKAQPFYSDMHAAENLSYELFDEKHDYTLPMRLSMLDWFDSCFDVKRNKVDTLFHQISDAELRVLDDATLKSKVPTTSSYVKKRAAHLSKELLSNSHLAIKEKMGELDEMLQVQRDSVQHVESIPDQGKYQRVVISTGQGKLIPLVIERSVEVTNKLKIVFGSKGNMEVAPEKISSWVKAGETVVLVDLFGLGERSSTTADQIDGQLPRFHTLSRSLLWLGESMMSIWLSEMDVVIAYIKKEFPNTEIEVVGDRETAVCALMYGAMSPSAMQYLLSDLPYSYVPDYVAAADRTKEGTNMAMHLPGIISWGDVQLLLALGKGAFYVDGLIGISGRKVLKSEQLDFEYKVKRLKKMLNNESVIHFN